MSLLTFVCNLAINSLTDTIANKEIMKTRNKKYSFYSLIITIVWIIKDYLQFNTRVFKFTKENSIIFLLIFIFSFLYFHLNASISTFIKKYIKRKNKNEENNKPFWALTMIAINIIVAAILVTFVNYASRGNNVLYEDTVGELEYKNRTYTIVIPNDTYFNYDLSKEAKEDSSITEDISSILETPTNHSIYFLKKGSNIELEKGTFIKYKNSDTYLGTKINSDESSALVYFTNDTIMTLKSNLKVKLIRDTKVMINHSSPLFSRPAMHLYILALFLGIYYACKLADKSE